MQQHAEAPYVGARPSCSLPVWLPGARKAGVPQSLRALGAAADATDARLRHSPRAPAAIAAGGAGARPLESGRPHCPRSPQGSNARLAAILIEHGEQPLRLAISRCSSSPHRLARLERTPPPPCSCGASNRATPKSAMRARPSFAPRSTLSGFRSWWTTPCACRYARPLTTSRSSSRARPSSSGAHSRGPRRWSARSAPPSTYSRMR